MSRGSCMNTVITQQGRNVEIISQSELRDPLTVGDYVRAYCHIHGSDHQRSLSINRSNGWGHCFNAACEATVLVAEWNLEATQRLVNSSYRGVPSLPLSSTPPPARKIPLARQLVLLFPPKAVPQWQKEERLALCSLDDQMRRALVQSTRAQAYLCERGIPLGVAQAAGVGYLPAMLL